MYPTFTKNLVKFNYYIRQGEKKIDFQLRNALVMSRECIAYFNTKVCLKDLNIKYCCDNFHFLGQLISLEKTEKWCSCEANCEEVNYIVDDSDSRNWFLGSSLQYGIRDFPEMRFKRNVIFGFTDLLGNEFCKLF